MGPQKPDPRIPRKKHMLYFLETKIRLISHYPEQKNATYWEKLKSFQAKKARSQNPKQKNTCYTLLKQRKRSHPQIPSKKRDILGKIKVFSGQKSQIPLSRAKKRDILGKIKVFSIQKSQIPESQEKNTCYTFLKQRKRSHPTIPSKKTRHTGKN